MVEPRREQRGGPAVVLGRAQDDDRVGLAPLVAVALVPDAVRRVPAERDDGDKPTRIEANEGRARASAAQRPWHFLYLAPDPHQHGSLRPIRAPVGV